MREESSTSTRAEILKAAEQCFGDKGYAGCSIQDIVAATRFSKPMIYYHFGSKEGLFLALLEEATAESYAVAKEAAERGGTIRYRLTAIAVALFGFLESRRSLVRLAYSAAFAGPAELPLSDHVASLRQKNLELLHEIVREGCLSGELSDQIDSLTMTHGIYGAICFHLMNNVTSQSIRLDRAAAEAMVDLFLNGALRRSPAP